MSAFQRDAFQGDAFQVPSSVAVPLYHHTQRRIMAQKLRQSTAVSIPLGPFVDSGDGDTPKTGLTIAQSDVKLKKNDGNWAQKNDSTAASHEESGWYEVALNATDTNTLGALVVSVKVAGALAVWREFEVVPANVYDAMVAGSDALQVDTTQWSGTAVDSANVLIDGAITAAKIASNAITDAKIASNAITSAKIANGAITADKIANAALTAAKFASGAFDAVWSVATRVLTAGTNIVLAKGTGITGFNDLDAAGVRSAVGLASANLDTQLGTIDSNVDAILEDTGTTLPGTLSTISGKVDTVDGVADAIKAVTDNLPDGGSLSSIAKASDLASVDGKIDTVDGVVDAIKVVTDSLPDSGALTSLAQASDLAAADAKIDDILEDTGTAIPSALSDISGAIGDLNDVSAVDVKAQVVAALSSDTYAEPGQGAPAATASLAAKIGYLYKAFRNKVEQTATEFRLYNDAGDTVDQKATVGDDGTTFTRSELESGS